MELDVCGVHDPQFVHNQIYQLSIDEIEFFCHIGLQDSIFGLLKVFHWVFSEGKVLVNHNFLCKAKASGQGNHRDIVLLSRKGYNKGSWLSHYGPVFEDTLGCDDRFVVFSNPACHLDQIYLIVFRICSRGLYVSDFDPFLIGYLGNRILIAQPGVHEQDMRVRIQSFAQVFHNR